MSTKRISTQFGAESKDQVIQAISHMRELMPFLKGLTLAERKRLKGIGNKNLGYVQKCLEGAAAFPNAMKVNFDLAEYKHDVQLFQDLLSVRIQMQALVELVDDSVKQAGADAVETSGMVYRALKDEARYNASAKTIVAEIAHSFRKTRANSNSPTAV